MSSIVENYMCTVTNYINETTKSNNWCEREPFHDFGLKKFNISVQKISNRQLHVEIKILNTHSKYSEEKPETNWSREKREKEKSI